MCEPGGRVAREAGRPGVGLALGEDRISKVPDAALEGSTTTDEGLMLACADRLDACPERAASGR